MTLFSPDKAHTIDGYARIFIFAILRDADYGTSMPSADGRHSFFFIFVTRADKFT